jgi:hypothetical protein
MAALAPEEIMTLQVLKQKGKSQIAQNLRITGGPPY